MNLGTQAVQKKVGVPPTEKVGVGLSAANPPSYLSPGFPLQSLTRTCIAALIVILNVAVSTHAQQPATGEIKHLHIPTIKKGEKIINHFAYSLSYNEQHEQANWVAYILTKQQLQKKETTRNNHFIVDTMIQTGSADNQDYKGSGFDRGHLAPAADMLWTKIAMEESFYYSNISPQYPEFNSGIWKTLEEQVRNWAINYDSLYIITGPIFTQQQSTIGHNNVTVPNYFYKIILSHTQQQTQALAFVIPNKKTNQQLQTFTYTIDHIEQLTGIDFYPALPDSIENTLEAQNQLHNWKWDATPHETLKQSATTQQTPTNQPLKDEATQCAALTKKGKRCKNLTKNSNNRCHLHQ